MTIASEYEPRSELGAKAKALASLVDEWGPDADEHGELAPAVVDALHRDGLFGMWVPQVLGGSELDPLQSLDVIEQLAYGDPSVGWVVMAACLSTGTAGSYLGDGAVAELFGKERFPVIAGQGTRPGVAVTDGDGYRLSGAWSFASGLKHGTHIHSLGIIQETGEPRIFVTPVDSATLIDNWDVMGLRGTGSIDYTMQDVWVHDEWSHFAVTEQPKRGGTLYHVGIIGFAEMCHAGWAMGVGRRLLDELAALSQERVGRAGASAASDSFTEGFGRAEGTYRAARALVYEQWGAATAALARGEHLSDRQHTLVRLALTHVTSALNEIANFVYLAAGTHALRRGTLQRLMRDVHAGTQHVTVSPPVVQRCGTKLAGLAEGTRWQFLDLVPA
jgi:alkylation response protein AidB-like acyl-CoA dehydrogenase